MIFSVTQSIRHACVNGSSLTMVLEFTKESPSALVIDWISSNLYFVDESRKLIEVYNIHSNARKVIVWNKLGDPRNIGLHPAMGCVFTFALGHQLVGVDFLRQCFGAWN